MNLSRLRIFFFALFLVLSSVIPVLAQVISETDDGTALKEIIIFGRHSVRSSAVSSSTLAQYSANTYPQFTGVPSGYLTPNGREAARLLGSYFHDYLIHEGLLTGNAQTDLARSYLRANSIQRSNITASMIGTGLIPDATTIPVHSYDIANEETGAPAVPDPVFDPILAGIATIDPDRAQLAAQGVYGDGTGLAESYNAELSLLATVLSPPGSVDPTDQSAYPFTVVAFRPVVAAGGAINMGGLNLVNQAIDPFIMQYADGFADSDVAWGKLTPETLSQINRFAVLQINMAMRTPYINQVQSSNAAAHILRTLKQAVVGSFFSVPGKFGNPRSRVHVITSSDYYVAGVAGLLNVHWILPGYPQDYCAPAGALVFELRQSRRTGEHFVRVYYTAQTLDQLRNLSPLTLQSPPSTMQLTVPGDSQSTTNLDIKFSTFSRLLTQAIDLSYVQNPFRESPPNIIHNVPLD